MIFKRNVGDLDAYFRITAGLSLLGMGIHKKSDLMIMAGSMKVAEGITRFCPVLSLLGISTNIEVKDDSYIDIY